MAVRRACLAILLGAATLAEASASGRPETNTRCSKQATGGLIEIAARDVYPESLAADAAGTLYVGSLGGVIFRSAPGGKKAVQWIRPDMRNRLQSIAGVLVDPAGKTLWACSIPHPFHRGAPTGSAVKAFDLRTGALRRSADLPDGAKCNDMAVDTHGTLFATDTVNGLILSLAPVARTFGVLASDAALRGINGIAFDRAGQMYVSNVSKDLVQAVRRTTGGAYAGVVTMKLNRPIHGPDGLRPIDGDRFLLAESRAGRIDIVRLSDRHGTVVPIMSHLRSPTGVAYTCARAYGVESKIEYIVDPAYKASDPNPFAIVNPRRHESGVLPVRKVHIDTSH